jgi:hypothetical protein
MFREIAFGVVLLIADAFVVVGIAHVTVAGAWVDAGVMLAAVGWLVLGEDADDVAAPDALEVDA